MVYAMWRGVLFGAATLVAACRANPNYCAGNPDNACRAGADGPADDAREVDGPAIDAPPYRPTAVNLAATYLKQAGWTNTLNSERGMASFWIELEGGDGQQQQIVNGEVLSVTGGVFRTAGNQFRFWLPDCNAPPTTHVDMYSQNSYGSASGWIHVLAAWDVSAGRGDLYIDGVEDRAANPTIKNGQICYQAGDWGIGGLSSPSLDANVADVYGALGDYLDIRDPSVRAKFITGPHGKPVDPGPDCSAPTGKPPTICLHGDLATWTQNKGVGGGLTVHGAAPTAAADNPAD